MKPTPAKRRYLSALDEQRWIPARHVAGSFGEDANRVGQILSDCVRSGFADRRNNRATESSEYRRTEAGTRVVAEVAVS